MNIYKNMPNVKKGKVENVAADKSENKDDEEDAADEAYQVDKVTGLRYKKVPIIKTNFLILICITHRAYEKCYISNYVNVSQFLPK